MSFYRVTFLGDVYKVCSKSESPVRAGSTRRLVCMCGTFVMSSCCNASSDCRL